MSAKVASSVLACLLLAAPSAHAGSVVSGYLSELDGAFSGGVGALPGRASVFHDVANSTFTDIGIQAFSDPQTGKITTVARISVGGDPALQGIGLARLLYAGPADTTFGGGDGRIEHTSLGTTNVVDACLDSAGRIVVATTAPGADGISGPKDLALARFLPDGALDTSYSTDGVARFSLVDNGDERDEAINDLTCLPNGNYFLGGYTTAENGRRQGVLAVMPAAGNHDVPVASITYGLSAGDLEGQVTAVHFNADLLTYVAAITIRGNTTPDRSSLSHLALQSNNAFDVLDYPTTQLGVDRCLGQPSPEIRGIDQFSANDFVVSFNYSDNGQRRAAIGRFNYGENALVDCMPVPFALANAAVTPPLVYADRVFVGLGIAPFNTSPVQTEIRSYLPQASGLGVLVDERFGVGGVARWSHSFNAGNANNNRSFAQHLFVDAGRSLNVVGTRVWNGNDTDVAVTRLGSSGVFNGGFESED